MLAPKKSISLRDLAKICGLSVSAVSYALHNSPRVSEATRKLVAEKAKQYNYQQDGGLSELMTHLRIRRGYKESEIIGVLHDGVEGSEPWKLLPALAGFYRNVVHRAEELGYSIASFPLHQPSMSAERLTRILVARGIRGLIIALPSLAKQSKLEIEPQHFAIAQCLHTIWEPNLPRVEPHHFENTMEAIHNLRALGYRSAGLILPGSDPFTTSHLINLSR